MNTPNLSPDELERYTRHLSLPGWGEAGQLKIKAASVLVVGVGGLGSAITLQLAGAGVGKIGLVDDDHVSLSNLQRQVLYETTEMDQPKVEVARTRLTGRNPSIEVETYPLRLTIDHADEIFKPYDLVLDGTDNFAARLVINQACVTLDKPYVFAAANRFDGQLSVFHASRGPCLSCLFPDPYLPDEEPSAEQLAILNSVPAVIGALQAVEAYKLILGMGESLVGRLLLFNALEPSMQIVPVQKRPGCQVCS